MISRLLLSQLSVVAPLTAAHIREGHVDKNADVAVTIDELEKASRNVPTEAGRVQRVLKKMTATEVGAAQATSAAPSVAAAMSSLQGVALVPTSSGIHQEPPPAATLQGRLVWHRNLRISQHPVALTTDKVFCLEFETLLALKRDLTKAWAHPIKSPKAHAARPDGSVVVAYQTVAGGAYQPRVRLLSADGSTLRDIELGKMWPAHVVCAPDGGFFVSGQLGIEAFDANGDKRWRFDVSDWPSPLTLDAQGNVHVFTSTGAQRQLVVLNGKGEAIAKHDVPSGVVLNAPRLGKDGTTYAQSRHHCIDIIDSAGRVSSVNLNKGVLYPPLALNDGRVAFVQVNALLVLNPDGSTSWSAPLEGRASPPVQAPDGTIHLHVVCDAAVGKLDHVESYSPSGHCVHRGPEIIAADGGNANSILLAPDGRLVVARDHNVQVYE